MADVVGASDVHERLASTTPCKGLPDAGGGQLRLVAHNNPPGFGAFPTFAGAAADQFPLKLGKPAQHHDFLPVILSNSVNMQSPLNPGIERALPPFQYIREMARTA
jgi:hypothetical protein